MLTEEVRNPAPDAPHGRAVALDLSALDAVVYVEIYSSVREVELGDYVSGQKRLAGSNSRGAAGVQLVSGYDYFVQYLGGEVTRLVYLLRFRQWATKNKLFDFKTFFYNKLKGYMSRSL